MLTHSVETDRVDVEHFAEGVEPVFQVTCCDFVRQAADMDPLDQASFHLSSLQLLPGLLLAGQVLVVDSELTDDDECLGPPVQDGRLILRNLLTQARTGHVDAT